MQAQRENPAYLPGVPLPDLVRVEPDSAAALDGAGMVVFATPAQAIREVAAGMSRFVPEGALLVSGVKGIEIDTLERPTEVLKAIFPANPVLCLSGPNFAAEVARGLPAATVLACPDQAAACAARDWFGGQQQFRVYTHDDIVGVEVGGALKNVVAIVAGMSDGLGLGQNARAAIVTRGLAEISRLGVAMGADPLTFAGLSGMGDLVLTSTGSLSRNQWAGRELGAGRSLTEILAGTRMVVEGVTTARAAWALAQRHNVEMPLTMELHQVLFGGKSAREVLSSLLSRSLRDERERGTVAQTRLG
jgi:glycerol-3-phosphate dehydrogenase (NAD(P)+)